MGVYKRTLKGGKVRWRFRGSFQGQKYISPAKYETEEEAREGEEAYVASLQGGTLSALVESRMLYLTSRGSNKDYLNECRHVFDMILKEWGPETPVRSITKTMAVRFLRDEALRRQSAGHTAHRVNHALRILRALFNYGIDMEDIDMKNPFRRVKQFPVGNRKKYIPTQDEVYAVEEYIDNRMRKRVDKAKMLFLFVRQTGCRINEAMALKVEDVYDETVVLHTRKAKNSDVTPRVVPRPPCMQEDLLPEEGRVFHEWDGYPHFLQVAVRTLKAEGRIAERWSWHNLRHLKASEWAAEGMTTFEIMNRLGHTNMGTTMGYLQELGVIRT